MTMRRPRGVKSIETTHYEERAAFFRGLRNLDRRSFLKVSAAAAAAAAASGVSQHFQAFMPIDVAQAAEGDGFRIAYVSDSHLYEQKVNERFVRSLLRAVDDVNKLDPQPDFVLYGGDLAQLGARGELDLGAQILKNLKAPVHMMVGEHDWFLDMGEHWQALFGPPTYSFDHKGVHFVVLNSIHEKDFWTERKLTPSQRMHIVAGLDNAQQGRFMVGDEQREWLKQDLAKISPSTPLIVFSHSPLYKYYEPWNFWTDDADEVQAILKRMDHAVVIHGHTHQILTNRIDNLYFHGMLSTAWPWPYAPEGLPALTVQMNRADPFDPNDGLGTGTAMVHPDGLVDKVYNLWNRDPVQVASSYLTSNGTSDLPSKPNLVSY
ncbi:MAG TPA: metallophosphoesterase [Candidatus Dormibacteraeota bacterium]|nr:metallophosphoesterase [Candidatus Dormibacteraeota bacterium]